MPKETQEYTSRNKDCRKVGVCTGFRNGVLFSVAAIAAGYMINYAVKTIKTKKAEKEILGYDVWGY